MELIFDGVMTQDEYLIAHKLASRPITQNAKIVLDLWVLFMGVAMILGSISIGIFFFNAQLAYIGLILLVLAGWSLILALKFRNLPYQQWQTNKMCTSKRNPL